MMEPCILHLCDSVTIPLDTPDDWQDAWSIISNVLFSPPESGDWEWTKVVDNDTHVAYFPEIGNMYVVFEKGTKVAGIRVLKSHRFLLGTSPDAQTPKGSYGWDQYFERAEESLIAAGVLKPITKMIEVCIGLEMVRK